MLHPGFHWCIDIHRVGLYCIITVNQLAYVLFSLMCENAAVLSDTACQKYYLVLY